MSIVDEFNERKYVHLQNFLSKEQCGELTAYLREAVRKFGWYDNQCPKSKSIRDDEVFDKLLADLLPEFEGITGKKLIPTYAFARVYNPGEELRLHLDRDACEISATITLGFDGDVWPIYMGFPSENKHDLEKVNELGDVVYTKDISKIDMEIGDAVIYHGCELHHWREEYKEGKWQAQVFLHYVDANGPYTHWANDQRPSLNVKKDAMTDDLTYWCYTDVMTDEDCDLLVEAFSQYKGKEADVGIGGDTSVVDKSVRNVNKIELPVYKGIGAILTAVGLDANQQRWKFDVNKSNQCDFLKYPAGGGRYKGHIDTFLSNLPCHIEECRKLTVLAFLNDNFTGGKFFLQVGAERMYPPQNKGTILVFPSFIHHGVEDVIEGERYSVVTWLVGPWFK